MRALCVLALSLCSTASAASLKIATWNLEWLIAPNVMRSMRDHCAPSNTPISGNDRRVYCDVALRFNRSNADFQALARYAKELNADVVALQEVDGASAASLVFSGYKFCFTARRHVQNNGFAIRNGIPYRCEADLQTISNNDSVRRGAVVTIYPGEKRELRLLSVHLKSGCIRDALTSKRKACRELARQVTPLENWIDAQARAGKRFAVLGDFNRNLLKDSGPYSLWAEIDDGDPPESDLLNAAENQPFVNCSPNAHHSAYIDYVVLSRSLGRTVVPGSFARVLYRGGDDQSWKLSDHCPVSLRVGL
jgi:endonuclease/exonuclease/phosphatase family metal-dependent hydrolase